MGPFIYYVITFLGFWDPPPPLRQHVFSTKNKQKLAFSDPPPPPQCPFLGIFVQKFFFIQKAVNLASKSLLALTQQVSTCFEDFMNIS